MKKHRPRPLKLKKRKPHIASASPITDTAGAEPIYYHGGPPGLAIGSYISPRASTGARANIGAEHILAQDPVSMDEVREAAAELDRAAGNADDATERTVRLITPCDPSSVYCTSLRLAAWYAAS